MKITLRQLEVFVAIANHTGHVTRAAQSIAMTQAAASMAIAELEQQLDTRVFDRIGKQLTLNEIGRLLVGRAQDVLDRVTDIQALASGRNSAFDIRLGASVTVGNHLLPTVMSRIKKLHPNGKVKILRYNTDQVLSHLLDFSIEVGFVEGPIEDSRFISIPWKKDRLTVFASPRHHLANKTLQKNDVLASNWIMRELGSGTRKIFERACATNGIAPNVFLELEQPEAIRQCVQADIGIGCLSILELKEHFANGNLAPIKAPFLDLRRDINIVINRQKFVGQGIKTILEGCGIKNSARSTSEIED